MKNFINSSLTYFKSLQSKEHLNILMSQRKIGFNSLIVCLQSINRLFDNIIKPGLMSFILSYKLSQDHLEMLFSAVRARLQEEVSTIIQQQHSLKPLTIDYWFILNY